MIYMTCKIELETAQANGQHGREPKAYGLFGMRVEFYLFRAQCPDFVVQRLGLGEIGTNFVQKELRDNETHCISQHQLHQQAHLFTMQTMSIDWASS